MKLWPSTIRGQIVTAFSACFLFMAVMIAINYGNFYRLSGSMRFFEIAEELNSSLLEMRRYEKNYFLYQQEHDFEENITYTNRLSLILHREKENLTRSMGKENYSHWLKTASDYSAGVPARTCSSSPTSWSIMNGAISTSACNGCSPFRCSIWWS
jgi:two-component system NtrC family sensor kinase